MNRKEIQSLQHPLVKHLVKLYKESGYREEKKALLIEGEKQISEYRGEISLLITTQDAPLPPHLNPKTHLIVPFSIIQKISGLSSPEPFLAEVPFPTPESLEEKALLLALDQIQDPGNLGTLLRSALAFGFEGVFLVNCCDPFNPKALRAAKGATFLLPLQKEGMDSFLFHVEKSTHLLYIADKQGEELSMQPPLILVLGNEAHGPSELLKRKGKMISIPIDPKIESLNVAVAGSILMHQVQKSLKA